MAVALSVQADDDIVEIAKELFSSSSETPTPTEATVIGKIPDWFEGSLLRVGPGYLKFIAHLYVMCGTSTETYDHKLCFVKNELSAFDFNVSWYIFESSLRCFLSVSLVLETSY